MPKSGNTYLDEKVTASLVLVHHCVAFDAYSIRSEAKSHLKKESHPKEWP